MASDEEPELVDWSRRWMTEGLPQFASPDDVSIPRCVATADEAAEIIEADLRTRGLMGRPPKRR